VRVIAGQLKGRRLKTPTWEGLRPTSDRLRETLFNLVASRVEGARVLDGYAGTGAVGLEALSRGALHVTFVEQDPRALALIEENAAACRVQGRYTIARGDFVAVAARLSGGDVFDLIVLDPPYAAAHVRDVLDCAARILSAEGLLALERATRREPEVPATLERVRDVRSGDSTLTLFTRA